MNKVRVVSDGKVIVAVHEYDRGMPEESGMFMIRVNEKDGDGRPGRCLYLSASETMWDLAEGFLGNVERIKSMTRHACDGDIDEAAMRVYDMMVSRGGRVACR